MVLVTANNARHHIAESSVVMAARMNTTLPANRNKANTHAITRKAGRAGAFQSLCCEPAIAT